LPLVVWARFAKKPPPPPPIISKPPWVHVHVQLY
jgi:hypothetical protein